VSEYHDGREKFDRVRFLQEHFIGQSQGAADHLQAGNVESARICTANAQVLERCLRRAKRPVEVRLPHSLSEQRGPSLAAIEAEVAAARRSVGHTVAGNYSPALRIGKRKAKKRGRKLAKRMDRNWKPSWDWSWER
jgi:hypothetical protein